MVRCYRHVGVFVTITGRPGYSAVELSALCIVGTYFHQSGPVQDIYTGETVKERKEEQLLIRMSVVIFFPFSFFFFSVYLLTTCYDCVLAGD